MSRPGSPIQPLAAKITQVGQRLGRLWTTEIWQPANLTDSSLRGWCYACLRVLSITWTVFVETKVPSRAAALSFSSLLGLGPMIAIAVLVGGFVLGNDNDPTVLAHKLGSLLEEVAPQLRSLQTTGNAPTTVADAVNPQLVSMLHGFVTSARSGYGGAFGALSLVLIVLLMFKAIEDAFNDIWGIRLGRS